MSIKNMNQVTNTIDPKYHDCDYIRVQILGQRNNTNIEILNKYSGKVIDVPIETIISFHEVT